MPIHKWYKIQKILNTTLIIIGYSNKCDQNQYQAVTLAYYIS